LLLGSNRSEAVAHYHRKPERNYGASIECKPFWVRHDELPVFRGKAFEPNDGVTVDPWTFHSAVLF
jgi:hypothetical protein